jgi:hypothetical protein
VAQRFGMTGSSMRRDPGAETTRVRQARAKRVCKARPWQAVMPIADALFEQRSWHGRDTHRRFNTFVKFAPHGALMADNRAQGTCGDSPEHRLVILVQSGASFERTRPGSRLAAAFGAPLPDQCGIGSGSHWLG